ncbi:hypothetical protein B7C42_03238 [Nocardia cerradoensis]|uniref:Uncharacterized protein n=1 Tax=Nocardia cerradoensis TaxID=85688 RepID=A0A231H6I5_9NOCA|nr:hypothetical protein [Nocardia cerradoensis]OXR44449.1 hypothetical protein B7C42_03238 [Nocardia cerradoensis]
MRLLLDRPFVLAWMYVLASVVLGPFIFLGGYSFFTQGVGDYCDAVHGDAAARDAAFRAAQTFQITGAAVMLALGLLVLIRLWSRRDINQNLVVAASGLAVVPMMGGFVLIILLSGPGGQSCWPS